MLFTLGLGMLIGAQIAGVVEARYTPELAKSYAAAVAGKGAEIKDLEGRRSTVDPSEAARLDEQIRQLTAEKDELRRSELRALEWRPIWGLPAIFAAFVLVLFVIVFRERARAVTTG